MTTIIAIQGNGWATLTADTKITQTDEQGYPLQTGYLQHPDSKLITKPHNTIIGIAGDVRAINIIQHAYTPPKPPPNPTKQQTDRYITTKLLPALQTTYQKHGYTTQTNTNTRSDTNNSQLIIAINTWIYTIDNNYGWATDNTNHYAIGTGAAYALGHLHNQHITKTNSHQHTIEAINTAAHYDPHTGGQTHTKTQTRNPE